MNTEELLYKVDLQQERSASHAQHNILTYSLSCLSLRADN